MRKTFFRLIQSILALPPKYFYAIWACGVLSIFFLVWWNISSQPIEEFAPKNERLHYAIAPEPLSSAVDPYEQLLLNARETTWARTKIAERAADLETYIVQRVRQEFSSRPEFISDFFWSTGIDRERFAPRFAGSPFTLQRWRKAESAVRSDDAEAFNSVIDSCFRPWSYVPDFEITIKPYDIRIDRQNVTAQLILECFGRKSRSNGSQGTSIWATEWTRRGDSLELDSVEVLAQEEVSASLSGGKLFQDCTASILRDCDSLANQLSYGLDQWAQRIPNLDIFGNQGIAIGDVDGDGLDDLYVCQPHGLPNLLFVQNRDGTANDVSRKAKVDILDASHAALLIDLDNDRDQDLVITTDESLVLLSNDGSGNFELEHSMPIGRGAGSIAAADFDNDGDLDLYLCKFSDGQLPRDLLELPRSLIQLAGGGRNILLRNDEGWVFSDVTKQAGLGAESPDYSRSATWIDFDLDGDQDLFVANEFSADRCYRNDGGQFFEIRDFVDTTTRGRHRTLSVGEFNADGKLDFFVGGDGPLTARDLFSTKIQISEIESQDAKQLFGGEDQIWFSDPSGESYRAYSMRAPIFSSESGFGSAAADLNNDGLDDIVVANGMFSRDFDEDLEAYCLDNLFGTPSTEGDFGEIVERTLRLVSELCRKGFSLAGDQHNRCFLSLGQLGFANLSAVSGLDLPDDTRAVATTDWDKDGDTDIVMTCRTGPQLRIFCNQLDTANEFVSFDLTGTDSNADAIGAQIEVFLAGKNRPLVKILQAGSGFLSQSSKHIVFGLGPEPEIQKVVVTWPNGHQEKFSDVRFEQELLDRGGPG